MQETGAAAKLRVSCGDPSTSITPRAVAPPEMTPFEHLAVLISIVIGLGITQLLVSIHRLAQARERVRLYWLSVLWVALIFVAQVEWWWSIYTLRDRLTWNFFYFLFVLLSPVSLFLAAAFALPEVEPHERYDLRLYYYRARGWFFGAVAVGPMLDAVRRGVEAGTWRDLGACSNALSALLVASLAVSRRPSYHALITLAVAGLFLYFILEAALRLR